MRWLVFLSVLLLFSEGCKGVKDSNERSVSVEEEPSLTCEGIVIHEDTVFSGKVFYGVLEPYRVIEYTSPVSGEISFIKKGRVKKGEKVIDIEDSTVWYQYELIKSKINMDRAFIERGFYKPEYFEYLEKMKTLEGKIYEMHFPSPFDGIVEVYREKGDRVKEGEKIFTLYETDLLKVRVPLNEEENMNVFKNGMSVRVFKDSVIGEGFVEGFHVNRDNNTVYLVIGVYNRNGEFKIGEFVKVKVILDKKYGLMVPNSAIRRYKDRYIAFKIEGNRVIWKYIEVALQGDKYSIVQSGLEAGDTILINGVDFAVHNMVCKKVICSNTY